VAKDTRRKLAAILAADVVGYSRLIRADEEGTLDRLKSLRADLIDPKIVEHHGRIVKLMGDGMLAEFASVVDAVRAAVQTQQGVSERNAGLPDDQRIEFRIGINLGDVVIDGDDIHGDGVNVAARLEGLAEPRGICISGKVYEEVRDRMDLAFEDLGEQEVKNIDRPVRVWRWIADAGVTASELAKTDELLPLPDKPSIAVLAFKNLSGDPEQSYFADAIAEDITTELSRFQDLFVISRESAFSYRDQAKTAKAIAAELGIDYLLEGSVQRAGERLRVNVQLIEAKSERHLWSERYDRVLTDLFAVQDEIVNAVVSTVGETVWRSAAAELKRKPIENFAAYDYALRARELLHRFDKQSNQEARALLIKAIGLDPNLVDSHITLAWTYVLDYLNQWEATGPEALDHAFAETEKAAALEGDTYRVHRLYGRIASARGEDDKARAHIERALELNPNDGDLIATYGGMMCALGRLADARTWADDAIRRNPHYPGWYATLSARIHYLEGADDQAVAVLNRLDRLTIVDHALLAASYAQLAQTEVARRHVAEVLAINPNFTISSHIAAASYRRAVDRGRIAEGLRKAGLPE